MSGRRKFSLDKANGKWMGVCAGIANYFGWDPTIVRVGAVVVTLLGAFPWTLIAYIAAGLIAKPRRYDAVDGGYSGRSRLSTYDLNHNLRDIDRRMAEVDSYVVHSNHRLAREIEELR
jgi:phage shock protein C